MKDALTREQQHELLSNMAAMLYRADVHTPRAAVDIAVNIFNHARDVREAMCVALLYRHELGIDRAIEAMRAIFAASDSFEEVTVATQLFRYDIGAERAIETARNITAAASAVLPAPPPPANSEPVKEPA
jgi:hypothetical protein